MYSWAWSLEVRSVVLFIVTDLLWDECSAVCYRTVFGKYMFPILINIALTSTVNANHNSRVNFLLVFFPTFKGVQCYEHQHVYVSGSHYNKPQSSLTA
jgi:hypothetical protein